MASIAIITARGGSKRIPKKNIREFLGKPIIAYSIEAAKNAGIFDTVMVSTDSEEIAQIAKDHGAEVPFFRSAESSNDFATTADVLREVLDQYSALGQDFEFGCCLYPTAPFVTGEMLREAYDSLKRSDAKTLVPVVPFSFPPQRGVYVREGKLTAAQPECQSMRSQDLEKIYHDCGAFYMFRTAELLKEGKLVTDNTIPYVMEEKMVQDIDNPEDWEMAEMKYKILFGDGAK